MKEGSLKKRGCLTPFLIGFCVFYLFILSKIDFPLSDVLGVFRGELSGFAYTWLYVFPVLLIGLIVWRIRKNKTQHPEQSGGGPSATVSTPHTITLQTESGNIELHNPHRGILVVGGSGSGKSKSVAIPLLSEFINKGHAGILYDFKFPELSNAAQAFLNENRGDLRHFVLNLVDPYRSHGTNPIKPEYVPNTSYAREYSQAIINNLMKESLNKPDFWIRSATDLLTACIWFMRQEHPQMCDLPHVFALITSPAEPLIKLLQTNIETEQMTVSIADALQRGANNQIAGVLGTLQGAIAQINTPELMYPFSRHDFDLQLNDPYRPTILTLATNIDIYNTLAPLYSLVFTVATKLMNHPDKNPSFVLLDEAPTLFVPNLDVLPNTGRSSLIAPVFMCQDLSQFNDLYTPEKADVLFAACNTHIYGRVASSKTAEVLSRQFGKIDKTFVTASTNKKTISPFPTHGESETVQERDIYRPAEFLNLVPGEFIGIAVESNYKTFRKRFRMKDYTPADVSELQYPQTEDIREKYKQTREEIRNLLSQAN